MRYSLTVYAALILMLSSSFAQAQIFKCKSADGKISFQSSPCKSTEQTSLIKVSSTMGGAVRSVQKEQPSVSSAKKGTSPSGSWVNVNNPAIKATLMSSGSFKMNDHAGYTLAGNWSKDGRKYSVKAAFQGMDFPVNMRYKKESDTLMLSKPGFPNSFWKYRRQ